MIPPIHRRWRGFVLLLLAAAPVKLSAQARGDFIIPPNRVNNGTRFSYWQAYAPAGGITYNLAHKPNLVASLGDDADPTNYSNWNDGIALYQIGAGQAFVLSGGYGIYYWGGVTKFKVSYTHSGEDDVKGVLLQFQMAGTVGLDSVELHYTPEGASTETVLKPDFKGLDNPGSNGFAERIVYAYEWNVTGKGVKNYDLYFAAGGASNPLYLTQVDTTVAPAFDQALGYLLAGRALPALRYGAAGKAVPDAETVKEARFFKAGESVPMIPQPELGFEQVGWVSPAGEVVDAPGPYTVTFSETEPRDLTLGTIFSPTTWAAFRDTYFNHEFVHGTENIPDESTDDTKSAPAVDRDGDGLSNFHEYAFGGQPYTQDAEAMTPVPGKATVEGVEYPAITYRRRAALASDLTYVVEVSSDLVTWKRGTETEPLVVQTNGPLASDGTRTVTARSLTPAASGPLFLRVKAETLPQ